MSYTLYHGCTKEALIPIMEGRFGENEIIHPWTCADGDTIFFHDKQLVKISECGYDDDSQDEFAYQHCLQYCNEQAQIQNACLPHPFNTTCVFEVTFYTDSFDNPINSWEDICVLDDSCPNMTTAVCMWADTFNQLVQEGRVGFKVHEYDFCVKMSLAYLAPLVHNFLFNLSCLSKSEVEWCKNINSSGLYFEELFELKEVRVTEYSPIKVKED